MKKTILTLSLLAIPLSGLFAQRVMTDNFDRLEVHYQTPTLNVESRSFFGDKALLLTLAGYQSGGEVGSPALPVSVEMITIPFCESLSLEVANAVYDTLSLSTAVGQQPTIYPLQPSRVKSDTTALVPVINAQRYATNAFYGLPLASVEIQGVARDRRLANLSFSPLQVNPVTGQVIVCRSADITVRYNGADEQKTRDHFERYFSPAFSVAPSLNRLFSSKEVRSDAPLSMVILLPQSLACSSIERFADWKRTQGIHTQVYSYDGSPRDSVAAFLKSLYDNATAENPAPTFLLLVGDLAQFPAFSSRLSSLSSDEISLDHVTDLYYVTWTDGDYLPDCFLGRFSATDTTILQRIVDKTLYYEKYAFADDSYLARAALIAGEDNGTHSTSGAFRDNAWIYADPTMDYIAKTYVNSQGGFDTVTYYKNNVDFAPDGVSVSGSCSNSSSATALRSLYNQGVGWINYSAHGDWDRWHKPSFTNNHVSSLNNNGKPSFIIGNCCLTNKFDKATCFGESLLRKSNNAGAVAYIGATNSTIWQEDFFWSVGIRANISNQMNTSYNASHKGMYDRLFHTHQEEFDQQAITAGAMVFSGNLSVNASSSRYKQYYWEIYELMGDPSLLPWLGIASDLEPDVYLYDYSTEITVTPFAYVALVDTSDGTVRQLSMGFADANGHISFPYGRYSDGFDHLLLSVTAQGRKPFLKAFSDMQVGIDNPHPSSLITLYPNPATTFCTITAQGITTIEVLDLTGRLLLSSQPPAAHSSLTLDISSLKSGVYLIRLAAADGLSVKKLIVQ